MLSYTLVAILSTLLAVLFVPRDWFESGAGRLLLSRGELALYDGEQGSRGLYLALLGQVFDVSKGRKHYGPTGAYHFMAGDPFLMKYINQPVMSNH